MLENQSVSPQTKLAFDPAKDYELRINYLSDHFSRM